MLSASTLPQLQLSCPSLKETETEDVKTHDKLVKVALLLLDNFAARLPCRRYALALPCGGFAVQ